MVKWVKSLQLKLIMMDIDIQVVDIDIGCSWFIAMALDFFHLRLAKPGVSERPKQPFVD